MNPRDFVGQDDIILYFVSLVSQRTIFSGTHAIFSGTCIEFQILKFSNSQILTLNLFSLLSLNMVGGILFVTKSDPLQNVLHFLGGVEYFSGGK
jgi:hypothetical protein